MATDVPVTIWQPTDGNSDFSYSGVNSIVDTTGTNLVDTTGVQIVDTGVTQTMIPATTWTEDDAI